MLGDWRASIVTDDELLVTKRVRQLDDVVGQLNDNVIGFQHSEIVTRRITTGKHRQLPLTFLSFLRAADPEASFAT